MSQKSSIESDLCWLITKYVESKRAIDLQKRLLFEVNQNPYFFVTFIMLYK